jgi:hypothetical protein
VSNEALDVDAVVAAVQRCPSVSGLSAGPVGVVATYLPGRRVPGVRVVDDRIEVHVVARWETTAATVDKEVRDVLAPMAADRQVDVAIDDIETPMVGTVP